MNNGNGCDFVSDMEDIFVSIAAYDVPDGRVDITNQKHLSILKEALSERGYSDEFINELATNLMTVRLSETDSPAAKQAKRQGLTYIGHGYWAKSNNAKVAVARSDENGKNLVAIKPRPVKDIETTPGKEKQPAKQPSTKPSGGKEQPGGKTNTTQVYGPGKVVFNDVARALSTKKKSLTAISRIKKWNNPSDKNIVSTAFNFAGDGDMSFLKSHATTVNQYVRVGGNLNDAKLYFATKEPNNFSQGFREKVEGIGKEFQGALMSAGMKAAATTTVGGETSLITSKMFAATGLFGKENRTSIPIKKSETTLSVGKHTVHALTEPSFSALMESSLVEVYKKQGSENPLRDAQFAMRAVRKHNTLFKRLQEKLDDKNLFIDPLPGVTPDTDEDRNKIIHATLDAINKKMKSVFVGSSSGNVQQIVQDIDKLKVSQNFEQDSLNVLTKIANSDETKRSAADIAELFTYTRRLRDGQVAYLPAASNFPLADLISMAPLALTKNSSAEDIVKSIQSVFVSFDYRSIKKGAGGASATDNKVDLSIFKTSSTRKQLNTLLSTTQTIWDAQKPQSVMVDVLKVAREHKIDVKSILRDPSTKKTIASVVARESRTTAMNPVLFKKQLVVHNLVGKMIEQIYNKDVDIQLFSNERYRESKKQMSLSITDGVKSLSTLEFLLDIGKFSKTAQKPGKPETAYATRFHATEL
jgi:hypothetical protein